MSDTQWKGHSGQKKKSNQSSKPSGGKDASKKDQGGVVFSALGECAHDENGQKSPESEHEIASTEEAPSEAGWDKLGDGCRPRDSTEAIGESGNGEDGCDGCIPRESG